MIKLFLVTLLVSLAVCTLVMLIFRKPIASILQRLMGETVHAAWRRYMTFAIYIVGISGGVRIWEFEKYLPHAGKE